MIDVTLSAQADRVKTAVIQILTEGGYALERKDDENLTTGHGENRQLAELVAPPTSWCRKPPCGCYVNPASEQSSILRLNVLYEGKDGLFTRWEDSATTLLQSAENRSR